MIYDFCRRVQVKLRDRIISSRLAQETFSLINFILYIVPQVSAKESARKRTYLFQAVRNARWRPYRRFIGAWVSLLLHIRNDKAMPGLGTAARGGDRPEEFLPTGLILKVPGPAGEKGVLFLAMEEDLSPLLRSVRGTPFFIDYDVVALSSWSPPNVSTLAILSDIAGMSSDPIYIGISNIEDTDIYNMLSPVVRPVPLMACDWLKPEEFKPLPRAQRDIDILMVANCAAYKRHWLLFDALRKMKRNLCVVLVGGELCGRNVAALKKEARIFGVKQDLIFTGPIPVEQVHEHQARARVSVILSQREGACVAVAESLFFGYTSWYAERRSRGLTSLYQRGNRRSLDQADSRKGPGETTRFERRLQTKRLGC